MNDEKITRIGEFCSVAPFISLDLKGDDDDDHLIEMKKDKQTNKKKKKAVRTSGSRCYRWATDSCALALSYCF